MGSYFKIDGRETNSKTMSGFIIDHIRYVDEQILGELRLPDKCRKWLQPEYRENGMGCGDWLIHRKGLAIVVKCMWETYEDDVEIRRLTLEDWGEYGQNVSKERGTFDEDLEEMKESTKHTLARCLEYLTGILVNMEINRIKRVRGEWV